MNRLRRVKQGFILLFSFVYLSASAIEAPAKDTGTLTSTTQPSASSPLPQSIIPAAPELNAKGYILMDANTGVILAGKNIDTPMPPASLTKLMTLYQIASALQAKRLTLNDRVTISEKAWRTGGSKMFVKIGDQVPVSDLVQGIAVVSGNDSCVAMAEHIAGTEQSFTELMNHSANLLGMKNSHFTDSTGLPDANHYTTPRDLALLTKAIVNQFPQYYGWYSQKYFEYNGIKQPNRDILLWRDPSIEGMKTGHTEDAGYCLVSTASRNGMRLISVIMGSTSPRERANASLALLNYGFRFYESKRIAAANVPVTQARIWYGKNKTLPIGVFKDLYITLPTGQAEKIKAAVNLPKEIKAPVQKGQTIGNLTLQLNNKDYLSTPLVALQDDPKGGIFTRLKDHVGILVDKLIHKANH